MEATKVCTACGRELSARSFALDGRRKHGDLLRDRCLECAENARLVSERSRAKRSYDKHRSACCERSRRYKAVHPLNEEQRAAGRESSRRYRARHPDVVSAYRAAHLEAQRAACRRWRARNPGKGRASAESQRAAVARWRTRHPDRQRAYARRYYAENSEARKANSARWNASHHEENAVRESARRARMRGEGCSLTAVDVRDQLDRQKRRCYWQIADDCKARRGRLLKKNNGRLDYAIEHVFPVIRGGITHPSNIVISCPRCNSIKHAKMPYEVSDRLC